MENVKLEDRVGNGKVHHTVLSFSKEQEGPGVIIV